MSTHLGRRIVFLFPRDHGSRGVCVQHDKETRQLFSTAAQARWEGLAMFVVLDPFDISRIQLRCAAKY